MKLEYKKVKVWKEHCHLCKEEISGDGSFVYPFICSCGVWMLDWISGEYNIRPVKINKIGKALLYLIDKLIVC